MKKLGQDGSSVNYQNEVDRYLAEACGVLTEEQEANFDILCGWKVNSPRYKVLSQIADRDVLSVPVSTAASESAFSTVGRILDPFRCSLSPRIMVECLICLKSMNRLSSGNIWMKLKVLKIVMKLSTVIYYLFL